MTKLTIFEVIALNWDIFFALELLEKVTNDILSSAINQLFPRANSTGRNEYSCRQARTRALTQTREEKERLLHMQAQGQYNTEKYGFPCA